MLFQIFVLPPGLRSVQVASVGASAHSESRATSSNPRRGIAVLASLTLSGESFKIKAERIPRVCDRRHDSKAVPMKTS
jgi:hypothetical protein